jgi:hypothetical protein
MSKRIVFKRILKFTLKQLLHWVLNTNKCTNWISYISLKLFTLKHFRLIYDIQLVHLLVCKTQWNFKIQGAITRWMNIGETWKTKQTREARSIKQTQHYATYFPTSAWHIREIIHSISHKQHLKTMPVLTSINITLSTSAVCFQERVAKKGTDIFPLSLSSFYRVYTTR